MSKLMSEEAYDKAAKDNPDAPDYKTARHNSVRRLLAMATVCMNEGRPDQETAGMLGAALSLLIERE
jgi:hypothetical protein